jgi:hypothetical protein
MKDETKAIGDCAVARLGRLLDDIEADTTAVVQTNDIPTIVTHFAYVRDLYRALKKRVSALGEHVNGLSYSTIPTVFTNQNIKTINVVGLGTVTINVRWGATMLNKEKGLEWLRETGNSGLIIETVAAPTLSSFARDETLAGRPLPEDLFKVGTSQLVSITKSGVSDDEPV